MFALSRGTESKLNPQEKRRQARKGWKGVPQVPICTGLPVTERHFLWRGLCGTEGIKTPGKAFAPRPPAPHYKGKNQMAGLPSRAVCWAARPSRWGNGERAYEGRAAKALAAVERLFADLTKCCKVAKVMKGRQGKKQNLF